MADIVTAKQLLDGKAALFGQAYQELVSLTFVTEAAARFLIEPPKGQYEDITVSRELVDAINRTMLALADARNAA